MILLTCGMLGETGSEQVQVLLHLATCVKFLLWYYLFLCSSNRRFCYSFCWTDCHHCDCHGGGLLEAESEVEGNAQVHVVIWYLWESNVVLNPPSKGGLGSRLVV